MLVMLTNGAGNPESCQERIGIPAQRSLKEEIVENQQKLIYHLLEGEAVII